MYYKRGKTTLPEDNKSIPAKICFSQKYYRCSYKKSHPDSLTRMAYIKKLKGFIEPRAFPFALYFLKSLVPGTCRLRQYDWQVFQCGRFCFGYSVQYGKPACR